MVSQGDTTFLLISAALVFIMIPGVSLFYGGLGSKRNLVSNMMSSIVIIGVGTIMWLLFGYSISFGESICGIFGKLDFNALNTNFILSASKYAPNAPSGAFIVFQLMFALLTPALIVGAIEGRMKFKSLLVFLSFWSLLVYYPIVHMNWAKDGLLGSSHVGALDFAGGNVVHITSGITGLILATLLGKRKCFKESSCHNVPFVLIGTSLLIFGWFGFNSGSALTAGQIASFAFLNTIASAAASFLIWLIIDLIKGKNPKLTTSCVSIIVGLVAITPGAGYVPVWGALIIGSIASIFSYLAIRIVKRKFKIDDALDVFACHGIGGIWGTLATGIFADPAVNPLAKKGVIFGGFDQFFAQLSAVSVTIIVVLAGTLISSYIIGIFMKLRVSEEEEECGLDVTQHEEEAYYA